MKLQKWIIHDDRLRRHVEQNIIRYSRSELAKLLGLFWNSDTDKLHLNVFPVLYEMLVPVSHKDYKRLQDVCSFTVSSFVHMKPAGKNTCLKNYKWNGTLGATNVKRSKCFPSPDGSWKSLWKILYTTRFTYVLLPVRVPVEQWPTPRLRMQAQTQAFNSCLQNSK